MRKTVRLTLFVMVIYFEIKICFVFLLTYFNTFIRWRTSEICKIFLIEFNYIHLIEIHFQDCGDGFHFDPVYNWCILEEDSKCIPEFPEVDIKEIECPASTDNDVILLPHPEECNYYFICLDGISVLMRCARTLLFDYIKGQCFFEETAVCFNRRLL